MFSNDAGEYHPKTKKIRLKWVIYWTVGVIICLLIPTCLVYLEAWEFNWNIVKIIWVEGQNYLFRLGHFMFGITSLLFFFELGYMTPENINGKKEYLLLKEMGIFVMGVSVILWLFCFITANILY